MMSRSVKGMMRYLSVMAQRNMKKGRGFGGDEEKA
jgi:hypothetical protein